MRDTINQSIVHSRKLKAGNLKLLWSMVYGLLFAIVYGLWSIVCIYASGAGTTAGVTLLSAGGVRQTALGNCGAALDDSSDALFYNPAILSEITQKRLSTFFTTGLSDDYKASVFYGLPLPTEKNSGLAFGVFHQNGGKMEINYVDGTSKNVTSQSDFLAILGWGGYWSKTVTVGYNFKYLSTELVEAYPASAIAFDAGLQVKSFNNRFRFGIVGQNYGTSIKYRSEAEPLPVRTRGGFSYAFPVKKSGLLLAIVDESYIFKEKNFYSSAGLEYSISKKYFLRGGVKMLPIPSAENSGRYNFTLGAGFKFDERYSLDWATELSVLNNPHSLAFSVSF